MAGDRIEWAEPENVELRLDDDGVKRWYLSTRDGWQRCGKKHLHRYAAEFAFRYSNRIANGPDDRVRADLALLGVSGKRLTYQGPN